VARGGIHLDWWVGSMAFTSRRAETGCNHAPLPAQQHSLQLVAFLAEALPFTHAVQVAPSMK